jgi:hypothetical protein
VKKIAVIYYWCIWLVDDEMLKKIDIIFSLQIFIHVAFIIDDKMMWMFKVSFENVIKIKSFQIRLKNYYQ